MILPPHPSLPTAIIYAPWCWDTYQPQRSPSGCVLARSINGDLSIASPLPDHNWQTGGWVGRIDKVHVPVAVLCYLNLSLWLSTHA
jgi:hypothetical protein